jgi:RNA polymerase sigma factor (sigma-70 family)
MNREPKPSIAAKASDGEPVTIEHLFREHNDSLVRFIAAKVGSRQIARDIAQQAYVQLLQLDKPETISYLRAFLFKTAANLVVDRFRKSGRARAFELLTNAELPVFELSPERQLAGEQALSLFQEAVADLPAKCRLAFVLHRVHGLEIPAIAAHMKIGDCMVRRYVANALDFIRHRLDLAGDRTEERDV